TILAEELDVPMDLIDVEFAPAAPEYADPKSGLQITGGSMSVASSWMPLRTAGATARVMLVEAAAEQWNVDPSSLTTKSGTVVHEASNRSTTYGSLATAASKRAVPSNVKLKEVNQFTLIGKHNRRIDTPHKINGTTTFGIDTRIPGMKFASIERPPV